jgi:hypothetical protein
MPQTRVAIAIALLAAAFSATAHAQSNPPPPTRYEMNSFRSGAYGDGYRAGYDGTGREYPVSPYGGDYQRGIMDGRFDDYADKMDALDRQYRQKRDEDHE